MALSLSETTRFGKDINYTFLKYVALEHQIGFFLSWYHHIGENLMIYV